MSERGWAGRLFHRALGGDPDGLAQAVDAAVVRGHWLDAEVPAETYGVSDATVARTVSDRLVEMAETRGPDRLDGVARVALLEAALNLGGDRHRVQAGLDAAAARAIRGEAERQFAAGGVDGARLIRFGRELGVSAPAVEILRAEHAAATIEDRLATVLADGQVDPAEDAALVRCMRQLGQTRLEPRPQTLLDAARAHWYAVNGPLTPVEAPILLQRGEIAHAVLQAEALEDRTRTVRVGYHGATASIRIMKGVYYRVGTMSPIRRTEQFSHSFGFGTLVATNKRLVWTGRDKTIAIRLSAIVDFEPFTDAVVIRKSSGKPVTFSFGREDRVAMILIGRCIEELR